MPSLQIAICGLHFQREYVDEGWFSVMIATQHVLMWSKLHYFAKVFNPTKNLFVDTIRIGESLATADLVCSDVFPAVSVMAAAAHVLMPACI